MTPLFVCAVTTHTDGYARCDRCRQLQRLAAFGVTQQLFLVAIAKGTVGGPIC